MFLGNIGGCLGETSMLLLLIGLVYLLIRKLIANPVKASDEIMQIVKASLKK